MSKRKRAPKSSSPADQPATDEATTSPAAEDAPKEDMAHVNRDLLAGSPDIFAPKWSEDQQPAPAADVVSEPIAGEPPPVPAETAAETPAETVETPAVANPEPAPVPTSHAFES